MKKVISAISFMGLSAAVFSQPFGEAAPSYKITELRYENSGGEKGTTFFRYNNRKKLTWSLWTLDNKSRSSRNNYEYDSRGNLISAFRDFSDGQTSFESFEYDTAGKKITEHFYRSDGKYGSATYKYKSNRLIRADLHNYKGWLSGRLELVYNNKMQKERGILLKGNEVIGKVTFKYDTSGNMVREFWDFNGIWNQTFNYVYVRSNISRRFYSSPWLTGNNNYRISRETYTYNNELDGPSLYYYNENGLLFRKVFTRSDSLFTDTFYNFNNEGKLLSSRRVYNDNKIAKFTYQYDESDNLISRYFFRADSLYGVESYLYNSDGELIKAYLKNFDGWLSGTIYFRLNELGQIANGEFRSEDGANATIIFSYNSQNLLSEITWKFSAGKFQRYTYEYESIDLP